MNAASVDAIQLLNAEVSNSLPAWYGDRAKLSPESPIVRRLKRSFFVRYTILDGGGTTGVLIKIPRPVPAKTLEEALASQKPRPSTRREFDILVACAEIVPRMDSQNLCAVRPLSYWPEWNAIAMEELKCRPLSAFHPRMPIKALWAPGAIAFETLLERAGRWLSIFHRTMGEMQIEPVSMPLLKSEFEDRLSQLQEFLGPRKELIHVRKMFVERIDAFQDASLPVVRLHGDFKSSNILISTDGRLAAVDTKMRYRGPIYMDIAKLLCDLQTDHFSAMTLGVFAHSYAWRKAFLSGYFGAEPCNERALQIYSVLAALDKWAWDEKLLAPRGPRYAPVRLLLRRHFPRLLIRMME